MLLMSREIRGGYPAGDFLSHSNHVRSVTIGPSSPGASSESRQRMSSMLRLNVRAVRLTVIGAHWVRCSSRRPPHSLGWARNGTPQHHSQRKPIASVPRSGYPRFQSGLKLERPGCSWHIRGSLANPVRNAKAHRPHWSKRPLAERLGAKIVQNVTAKGPFGIQVFSTPLSRSDW